MRRRTTVAGGLTVLIGMIGIVGALGAGTAAGQAPPDGTVVEAFDAEGHFSEGDGACGHPTEFVAPYAGQVVENDDGAHLVLDQKDTDDVLVGPIDPETGIPPVLENPGKETAVDGRLEDDRLAYRYRYIDTTGCAASWLLVFVVPDILPYFVETTGVEAPVTPSPPSPAAPSETTVPEPVTTVAEPAATAPETVATEPASDQGGTAPWLIVVAGGLAALVAVGGVRWWAGHSAAAEGSACDDELRAWKAAEADAQRQASNATSYEARFERLLAQLNQAYEDLKSGDTGMDYVERLRESAFEAETMAGKARAEADEAAGRAEAARQAYLSCIGQPEPAVAGGASGVGGTAPAGGEAVDTGRPAHVASVVGGSVCQPDDPPPEPPYVVGEPETIKVPADYHIRVVPAGMHPRAADADQFSATLGDLAQGLEIFGDALSGGGIAGAALKGQAGKAAAGAAGLAGGFPTSTAEAAVKVAELAADAGSTITRKVAEWDKRNDRYQIDGRTYDIDVTLTWTHAWRCVDGAWSCGEVLSTSRGPLRPGRYRVDGQLGNPRFEVDAEQVDREVARCIQAMQGEVARGWARVAEASTPSTRPCTVH